MRIMRICVPFIFFFCFFISPLFLHAQTTITITGQAFDADNTKLPLPKLMIINTRTNNGLFADAEGKFSFTAFQTDTILFSAIGFKAKKICMRDSVAHPHYYIEIKLQHLVFTLKEVSVFAPRTLGEIDRDIAKLDSSKRYSSYENINGLESSITYLYERFSRFGKSKQKVAEWENEDLKRDILKELFRLYIKNDIITLNEDEFESFIVYCNLSEEFIKHASQFELVMAIKGKYATFSADKDYYVPHEKRW